MAGDRLTWAEIEARYPNEWVLVERLTLDRHGFMQSGRVLFHSSDREAVYDRATELPPPVSIALRYTGTPALAADEEFALECRIRPDGSTHHRVSDPPRSERPG